MQLVTDMLTMLILDDNFVTDKYFRTFLIYRACLATFGNKKQAVFNTVIYNAIMLIMYNCLKLYCYGKLQFSHKWQHQS